MPFWTYKQNDDTQTGELQIDGVLEVEESWWENGAVVARNIRKQIERARELTVYINSPGGDVMAGAEIYTALREHSERGLGKVTVKVTGIAASAASIVAMAGDEILMSPVAYMMIHNPWTGPLWGNAKELRQQADILDVISEGLIAAYERRTGKSRDDLMAMLDGETYMSAQTCIDEGFADGLMWDAPQQPAAGTRQTTAKMQSRNHDRASVMAMLKAHGATHEPDPAEAARRAEIAKRAAIMAGLYDIKGGTYT